MQMTIQQLSAFITLNKAFLATKLSATWDQNTGEYTPPAGHEADFQPLIEEVLNMSEVEQAQIVADAENAANIEVRDEYLSKAFLRLLIARDVDGNFPQRHDAFTKAVDNAGTDYSIDILAASKALL